MNGQEKPLKQHYLSHNMGGGDPIPEHAYSHSPDGHDSLVAYIIAIIQANQPTSGVVGFTIAIPLGAVTTGSDKGTFHFAPGVAGTITEVYLMAKTAPGSGKTLTVDVRKNGTTIFTTQGNRPSLVGTATEDTSGTPDVTALAKNDKLTVDVDVSTSGTSVANVIVLIRGTQNIA